MSDLIAFLSQNKAVGAVIALAGAVVLWLCTRIYELVAEHRRERTRRLNAVLAIRAEIRLELEHLRDSIYETAWAGLEARMTLDETFVPFFTYEESYTSIMTTVGQDVLLLPDNLLASVLRFYKLSAAVDDTMKQFSDTGYAALSSDRKVSLLRYLRKDLLPEMNDAGTKTEAQLTGWARQNLPRNWLLDDG